MDLSKKIFQKKKFLIYGMGKTGLSSYNYLKKNNQISLYDDSKKIIKKKYLKKLLLEKSKINQKIFDYIVVSPGINVHKCNLKKYLKKNSRKIITDLDIFYSHHSKNKIITITGTNGKSTTAKLLNLILRDHKKDSRLCGNIGKPILEEKKISKKTLFVIEASSYQIAYSKLFKTNYAVILNISPDHLERHGSIENYVSAKFKLVTTQSIKDFAYMIVNDRYLKKKIKNSKIFSKIINVNYKAIHNFKRKITNPYFLSQGNQENLSFIFSLSRKLNLQTKKIIKKINKFKGLKYRQEIIYNNNKITFINDSKATSFAPTINILKSLKKVFWLVGGIGKLGDKFTLKKNECKDIRAYIFGKNKNFFIKQFRNKLSYRCFKDLRSAVKQVLKDTNNNNHNLHKTVLFSPSAASFDSFKNFEKRGEYFNFLLKKYKVKETINAIR
jgi:UDP-N-acetylmuramoylalanine--D-glutamate ligase